MKIISKHKDFYDSFGYILGKPDESIHYLRNEEIINLSNNDNKKRYRNVLNKIDKYLKHYTYGYSNKEYIDAVLEYIIVGIYPYIYLVPFYVFASTFTKRSYILCDKVKPIIVSEDDVRKIENHEKLYNKIKNKFDELINIYSYNYTKKDLYIKPIIYNRKYGGDFLNYIQGQWKIEDRDIFKELKVPVFIFSSKNNYITEYWDNRNIDTSLLYLNPVIVNQPFNVLGCFTDEIKSNGNIYIDIENFLWSIKQEPESIPDNKTKIINAGFDLKTSFRNM